MNSTKSISLGLTLTLATALACGVTHGCFAQGPDTPPAAPSFGGLGMAMGGQASNPLQSNPMGLLQRSEVQNELKLDLKQKKALDDLMDETRTGMRDRMRQATQGITSQEMRRLTPEQRQARMRDLQPQLQAAMQMWQGELNDKIKGILKPEQITRLYQLDKQRRGPLSMADPKVAEELKLDPEARQEIQKINNETQQQQAELMQSAFETMRKDADRLPPGQIPQFPDFTSKLSPWKQKMDKIRKTGEDKVMAFLNADEKTAWKTATGEPFTFRTDTAPQRPNRRAGG